MPGTICSPKFHVVNLIALITKRYIYNQRCASKKPNFSSCEHLLYVTKEIEYYIARRNNKLSKHYAKWSSLISHDEKQMIESDTYANYDKNMFE